ncbi:MAG: hypothetical protein OYH76_11635 [Defluviicoccus sp.]|nr:hypothetical protein [Defluviicoccus sp.]MDE0276537.1 hypothetical protein [Defluviicoccus sp.]
MTDDYLRKSETAESDPFDIINRHRALFLIEEYDLEAQLLAIRGLVNRNSESDKALAEGIKALGAEIRKHTDEYADYLQDSWIDHLHGSVFQDAAHSMSAAGMLAPFIESLFVTIFARLRAERQPVDGASDDRAATLHDDFWNPHYVFEGGHRRRDIVKGIIQLSESIGLTVYLPESLPNTLSALFEYRNKMFHNGFEWPMVEREKFGNSIRQNQWPSEWFSQSTSGGKPWIFYMSPEFIQHCLAAIDEVLNGVGEYLSRSDNATLDRKAQLRDQEAQKQTYKTGDMPIV